MCFIGPPLRNGEGTYTLGPEETKGTWEKDLLRSGRVTFASGAVFAGDFSNGHYAQGTYRWPDGSQYVGPWRDSKMHGQGLYTDARGIAYEGHFHNGNYFDGKEYLNDFPPQASSP